MQNSQTNYGLEEAGMAQLDDSVGALAHMGIIRYYCKYGCYFNSVRELTEHIPSSTSENSEHKQVPAREYWAKRRKHYRILQGME